jgi:hypothetical protein
LQLISSLALARTREAMHNSWDKNDPKDAQVILHLLKSGLTQHYHDPIVHNLNDLQEFIENPPPSLAGKDPYPTPPVDPLPAALFSGDRALPRFSTFGMVVDIAHRASHTAEHNVLVQNRVHSQSLPSGGPQSGERALTELRCAVRAWLLQFSS